MDPLSSSGLMLALSVVFIIVSLATCLHSNNDKTDLFGKKHKRPYFRPGRICSECGFRAITQIPTCPSCKTKFIKGVNKNTNLPIL